MNYQTDIIKQLFPPEFHQRLFLVGGSVRDLLLGRPSKDIDIVASLTPEEISSCGFRHVTGKSTAPIWLRHDDSCEAIEATLLPNMGELHADLAGRDFTINAIALTLDGEIIDPLHGREDLELGRLRACSSATFSADPLRIFRALRFEADGWKLDSDSEQQLRTGDWRRDVTTIPVERFSREMFKALPLLRPERFFQRMLELAAGENFLPEIFRMPRIPAGPLLHHPEGDLFTHSVEVLQRVSAMTGDPLTRFCAFFHDIGKLATPPDLYPRHHGHDQTGYALALEFSQRLRLPKDHGVALAWISKLHGTFNLWEQLRTATKLRVADQAIKAGIVNILPHVAAADKAGGNEPKEWRRTVEVAAKSATELGIDIEVLEAMKPEKRSDLILKARLEDLKFTLTAST
jgi:tRNA nucleotidyltransferase (CCA-adding enzyme)